MELKRQKRKPMAEINVIPLIDVMLVLLIVFMVTAPLITQGFKVELPKADAQPQEPSEEETLVVSVDAQGQYYINLGVTAAEDPQPVALELIGENVRKILDANPAVPVYLEADEAVTHGVVMRLQSTLVRAGATSVLYVTQPPGGGE